MDNQPIIRPVSEQERIAAQNKAIEQLTEGKDKGGRPTVITDRVVAKLIAAFQRGYNVTKACQYAKIGRDAFYDRMNADPEFADIIHDAQDYWVSLAGTHITNLLLEDKSNDPRMVRLRIDTSKWVYEKHMPDEYGRKEFNQHNSDNRQQHNYFLSVGDVIKLFESGAGKAITEEKLLEALEEKPQHSTGSQEATAAPIHRDNVPHLDSNQVNMPQPSSTL